MTSYNLTFDEGQVKADEKKSNLHKVHVSVSDSKISSRSQSGRLWVCVSAVSVEKKQQFLYPVDPVCRFVVVVWHYSHEAAALKAR